MIWLNEKGTQLAYCRETLAYERLDHPIIYGLPYAAPEIMDTKVSSGLCTLLAIPHCVDYREFSNLRTPTQNEAKVLNCIQLMLAPDTVFNSMAMLAVRIDISISVSGNTPVASLRGEDLLTIYKSPEGSWSFLATYYSWVNSLINPHQKLSHNTTNGAVSWGRCYLSHMKPCKARDILSKLLDGNLCGESASSKFTDVELPGYYIEEAYS